MFYEQISFALNLCEFKAPYQESDPLLCVLCFVLNGLLSLLPKKFTQGDPKQ